MASIYKVATGWRAQVRLKDKPTVSKILPSKREAQVWAREQEHALHMTSSNDVMVTFADLLAKYRAHAAPGGTTKQNIIGRLEKYWGDWRVSEIHSGTISDYAAKRRDSGAGPNTVLQDLIYLNVVLGHGGVLAGSRAAAVARLELTAAIKSLRHTGTVADSQERSRRPTEEELTSLATYFCTRPRTTLPMMDIALFAVATCMRLGEIVGPGGVVWEDLDITNRTIWVRARKDPTRQRDDLVPLLVGPVTFQGNTVDPCEIIMRQSTSYIRAGAIFPFSEQRVSLAFTNACSACSVTDLRFHDLRHDGISRLFEAGFDIPQVAAISGHKSWKNLARYTHLRPSNIKARPTSNQEIN